MKDLSVTRVPETYLLKIRYRSPDRQLAADVVNAIANSYVLHSDSIRYSSLTSVSRFLRKQLPELKANMERSGAALAQLERELNIVDAEKKTSILSLRLLQLNTEYTNAQSDRVKEEAAYHAIKGGSLEAAQISTQGDNLRKHTERLLDAVEKFAQIKTHFGANHPEYRRAVAQIKQLESELTAARQNIRGAIDMEYRQAEDREKMLKDAVAQYKAELDRINARSFMYETIKRDAETDSKLYKELTRKIKEAEINSAFQNGAIRLADVGRPAPKPTSPRPTLNLIFVFFCSSLLAVAIATIADALDRTVRDPKQTSRLLNTDVIGALPRVKHWHRGVRGSSLRKPTSVATSRRSLREIRDPAPQVVAPVSSAQQVLSFEDAIRILLNSILLSNGARPLRSIMISSAFPKEGKTTIATHLAMVHAKQKRRCLLIDSDLRSPGVSSALGLNNDSGLSKVLQNKTDWRREITKMPGFPDLDIICAGPDSLAFTDMVGKLIRQMLKEAGSDYDLIIVDAPPLLGIPEALQMAAAVDGVAVTALAGHTCRSTLDSVLGALQGIRANVVGLVLNETNYGGSDAYQYYGYSNQHQNYAPCRPSPYNELT